MRPITIWMTVVGVFYVAIFVAATFVKLPIQDFISEDVLGQVPPGDEVFRLLEDTWVMFGLELGVIGVALIIGSRVPNRAKLLVWTVLGLELVRGIVDDLYMLTRGYETAGLVA
ncbi:MAG: BphX family protein [Acidimicrobiia bacterium]